MNISKLLSKITAEITLMKDQINDISDKREKEKCNYLIIRINNYYNYLRKEILTVDEESDLSKRIQIQKDLNSILRCFRDENVGTETKLLTINKNINKLTVKYSAQGKKSYNQRFMSIKYDLQSNNYYVNGMNQIYNPVRLRTMEQKEGYIRAILR